MSAEPPFLGRATYRRRRLEDAARLLPVLTAILFCLPVMWATDGASIARSGIYLFVVWAVMIVGAAVLTRALRRTEGRDTRTGREP